MVLGREVMLAKVPLLRQPLQLQHDDDIATPLDVAHVLMEA